VAILGADRLKDQTRFGESQEMVSAGESAGRQVATISGNYVGKVADIHIDPTSSRVMGYEVTGGLFARMFGRTHTIEASGYTHLGRDLLIVGDEVMPAPDDVPQPAYPSTSLNSE
jgi:uncharacterized protein YrrD